MILSGKFLGQKSGTFAPDDSEGTVYPYTFAKVADDDGEGWTKVKPSDGGLEEYRKYLATLTPNAAVTWRVALDRYGNLRFVESVK